mgnify:FL=1
MNYQRDMTGQAFATQTNKAITLLGMSGVGKTTLANRLPKATWFHYSGDYRIGTRYLEEPILDVVKRQAMKDPMLQGLLRADEISIEHNITVNNLDLVSKFLGMIGSGENGGLRLDEFKRRQELHRRAEISAMFDVPDFIERARETYGYPNFINDAGGSLCELNEDSLMKRLAEDTLIIYLQPSTQLRQKIIERSLVRPKPMYYQDDFFDRELPQYLSDTSTPSIDVINPDDFFCWIIPRLIAHREPLYRRIADEYGVTVDADEIMAIRSEDEFLDIVAAALDRR